MQIQRMCTNYCVADYEVRLTHEVNHSARFTGILESHFTRDFAYSRIARHCERPK